MRKNNSQYKQTRLRFYGKPCHYCDDVATTMDHKIPIVKGGTHHSDNLLPACENCNREKRELDYELFKRYVRRYGSPSYNWRARTNKQRLVLIHAYFIKRNKSKETILETFGEKLLKRYYNMIERGHVFKLHSDYKNEILQSCGFCNELTDQKIKKVFSCEECSTNLAYVRYDLYSRYVKLFGKPTDIKSKNIVRLKMMDSILRTSKTPIQFYNICKKKNYSTNLIKRFIKSKRK